MGCFRFDWKCTHVLPTRWRERVGRVTMWYPTPTPTHHGEIGISFFLFVKYAIKKSAGHCNIIHQRQTLHMLSCTISCVHRWCILISLHFHSISNVFRTLTIPKIVMLGIVKMYQMYKYTSFSWCYPDISRYFIHIIHQYRILIPLFLPLCVLLD